jgi:NTE family protein
VENFGAVTETDLPSAVAVLRQRLLGSHETRGRHPYLSKMMFDVPMLHSASRRPRAAELADILIRPDVQSIGMVEWKAFDRAIEAGYRAAVDALSTLDANDRTLLYPHE